MSHFYNPKNNECLEGLRLARKVSALPSKTTVLQLIKGAALIQYIQRQMFQAVATTDRKPEWTDDQYYAECLKWADEHSDAAKHTGSDFHGWCEQYNIASKFNKTLPAFPKDMEKQAQAYARWFQDNIKTVLCVEEVLIGKKTAGRVDLIAELKDGRVACVDVKSQGTKGKKKFNHYPQAALQQGSYSEDFTAKYNRQVDCLITFYASSTDPDMTEAFEWSKPPEFYAGLLNSLAEVWMIDSNYYPMESVEDSITKAGL